MGACSGVALVVDVPIAVVSEANRRDHWAVRARRVRSQRAAVRMSLHGRSVLCAEGYIVTLIRFGGRRMDTDNLCGAFKAVRDEVAQWINIDDGSDRLEWRYLEGPRKRRETPRVRIQIQPRGIRGSCTWTGGHHL